MSLTAEASYFRAESLSDHLKPLDQVEFWTRLNPGLAITDHPLRNLPAPYAVPAESQARLIPQVSEEGYFHTSPVIHREDCRKLQGALERIIAAGLHPMFLSLYDLYWQVMNRLGGVLTPVLGEGHHLLADYWIWCISPQTAGAGWPPHRDLQFPPPTLREDQRPKIVTVWVPFTDATPLNGCMYALPMNRDKNVQERDLQNYGFSNLQDVRALPAEAGSVLGWNQYLLHWGSRCSEWADGPRISTGMYFQSGDVPPYLPKRIDFNSGYPFAQRLGYIASMLLNYHGYHRYQPEVVARALQWIEALPNGPQLIPAGISAS